MAGAEPHWGAAGTLGGSSFGAVEGWRTSTGGAPGGDDHILQTVERSSLASVLLGCLEGPARWGSGSAGWGLLSHTQSSNH